MHKRNSGFYLWIELGILSLLFGLFAYSFQKLIQPENKIAEVADTISELSREPATITEASAAIPIENILNIGCLEDSPITVNTKARNVRLSAIICKTSTGKLKSSQVKNLTTGQEITGIPAEDMKKFATDFFHLVPGDNHLSIELKEANGKNLNRNLTIIYHQ